MATIVLAGGGTGGHVYPALAIGDELRERGHNVLYYGDASRLEGRVVPQRGYTFRPVNAAQFPRRGLMGKIKFAFSLLGGVIAARKQLRADGVTLVLGVGGYISAPTVLGAWTLGLKTSIHEANVTPGLANRLCARVADQILLTFEKTASRLPGAAPREVVGVPVNPKVLVGDRRVAAERYGLSEDRPTVLFVGGSLGAARINELALGVAKSERDYQVLHLCGPKYEAACRAEIASDLPEGYALVGYEDQMGQAYAMADLVVCRAGSSTLAELTALGKASLLVPSPNVTDNHQEGNARGLEADGAAEVLVEQGWELNHSIERVDGLMAAQAHLEATGRNAKAQARMDAASRASDILESLVS